MGILLIMMIMGILLIIGVLGFLAMILTPLSMWAEKKLEDLEDQKKKLEDLKKRGRDEI